MRKLGHLVPIGSPEAAQAAVTGTATPSSRPPSGPIAFRCDFSQGIAPTQRGKVRSRRDEFIGKMKEKNPANLGGSTEGLHIGLVRRCRRAPRKDEGHPRA